MESDLVYNSSLYSSGRQQHFARRYLRALPKDIRYLVSGGSSGHAIASAMLALSDRDLFHCHIVKPSDTQSHRGCTNHRYRGHFPLGPWAFVDDVTSSGDTYRAICEAIENMPHYDSDLPNPLPCTIVLVWRAFDCWHPIGPRTIYVRDYQEEPIDVG